MAGTDEIRSRIEEIVGGASLLLDEPMAQHTTFRIGGPADYFAMPHSAEEVSELIRFLDGEGIPRIIIGNGSNLLVPDEGIRGAVIRLGREFSRIETDGCFLRAEAGALLSSAAAEAEAHSLTGMEFAGGIPGTFGGACIMNAGAYGGEMKDILESAEVLSPDGEIRTMPVSDMELGYRSSVFMRTDLIVLSARLRLSEGNPREIRARSEELRDRRRSKQPLDLPSAGSAFKRPGGGLYAGKLIMDAGLRGYRVGGAEVSEKHCGFVVNRGGATAADVRKLLQDVQRIVYEKSGVMLEPEVRIL